MEPQPDILRTGQPGKRVQAIAVVDVTCSATPAVQFEQGARGAIICNRDDFPADAAPHSPGAPEYRVRFPYRASAGFHA